MRQERIGCLLGCVVFSGWVSATTVDTLNFADLTLSPDSFFQAGPGVSTTFASAGMTFPHNQPSFDGSTYAQFTYSNRTDTTTGGFTNDASAITGSGDGDANYGVGFISTDFSGDFSTIPLTADFTWPGGARPQSMRVTNTTYSALSMLNGDTFAKKFGGVSGNDEDFFKLSIEGLDDHAQVTGSVEFFLADFRFVDNSSDFIVTDWTTVDLTPLGSSVRSLRFGLASSDTGSFGMNTPAYFAFDELVYTIPEPSIGLLASLAGIFLNLVRPRRRR